MPIVHMLNLNFYRFYHIKICIILKCPKIGHFLKCLNLCFRGGYAKPKITDILWIKIIVFPYALFKYCIWYIKWIWTFTICKKAYGDEEKLYLIRKLLKMGQNQFDVSITIVAYWQLKILEL